MKICDAYWVAAYPDVVSSSDEDEEAASSGGAAPVDLDEIRISTMTRTTTCRSGGFALAVAPPPAMAVAPLHKFIVNASVRLLRPSVRQHSLRTSRTPTYETYDHPYVKLDVVRVVRRTTSRCFTYGPS